MNEMSVSPPPPANRIDDGGAPMQSKAIGLRTGGVRSRGLLCLVGLLIVVGLVCALALLAPWWGGLARAQEPTPTGTTDVPTATPTVSDTPTPTETSAPAETATETPTEVPTETPTEVPTGTAVLTETATATPSPQPTETATPLPMETATDTMTPSPTETATPTPTTEATTTATPIPEEGPRYLRGEIVALEGQVMTVATAQGNENVAVGPEGQVLVGRRFTSIEGLRVGDVVACIVRGSEGFLTTDFVLVLGHAALQEEALLPIFRYLSARVRMAVEVAP